MAPFLKALINYIEEQTQYHIQKIQMSYDIVVVGGGVFGLSTCIYIAIHYPTIKFALVQQYKVGHGEGSSHSDIRIIRSTYEDAFYRDLCYEGIANHWLEVQKLLGKKFIEPNSCLLYVEEHQAYKNLKKVAETSNGQIEMLPVQIVRQRFPSAPCIDVTYPVFHDKKAGVVLAKKYIQSSIQFLRNYKGIDILEETSLICYKNSEKGVTLTVKNKNKQYEIKSKKVSLSCGRWIGQLMPITKEILLEARQTVSFWQMKKPEDYTIGKFPCWMHMNKEGIVYYGLPDYEGMGLKYGLHSQDSTLYNRFPTQAQYLQFMGKDYLRTTDSYFKGRYQKLNKLQKCYYTVTKTEDFLIDWSDEHENILIVSPCSGHGFKFGPIIGKIVADLLMSDVSLPVFEQSRYKCRLFYHIGVNLK